MTTVGKPFTEPSIPEGPIQLFKVRVSIENVLKGRVSTGLSEFFYFGPAAPAGAGQLGFFGTAAFRSMLLLREEQGKLRTLRDVTSNCIAVVHSGAHLNYKPVPGKPLREQMIDLFLTPGAGVTAKGMVQAIFEHASFEVSPAYTAQALLALTQSVSPVVRTAACLELRDGLVELSHSNLGQAVTLAQQLGMTSFQLQSWRAQQQQNGWARNWWAHGPPFTTPPSTLRATNNLTGVHLCVNDQALGVPPLKTGVRE